MRARQAEGEVVVVADWSQRRQLLSDERHKLGTSAVDSMGDYGRRTIICSWIILVITILIIIHIIHG